MLGLFFSFGKISGVMLNVMMQMSLQHQNVGISWRLILSVSAPLALTQALLLYLFGFDTPTELIERGQRDEALQTIKDLYY
jgi:hypothetical protein